MTNKMVDFTSIKKKATRFRFSFLFLAMSSAISLSACGSEGSSKKADTTPSSPIEQVVPETPEVKPYVPGLRVAAEWEPALGAVIGWPLALPEQLLVDIAKEDYSDKVEKILSDYRKSANIPGFRKGHVPMTMVKKQYGKAVLVDEVNKLLQDALNKYLTEEKLDVLGNPLPKPQDDLDWDADNFSFEFELGLAPEFEVNLKSKKAITQYNIVANDKMLDDQVEHIRKQYGKLVSQDTVAKDSEITGVFVIIITITRSYCYRHYAEQGVL